MWVATTFIKHFFIIKLCIILFTITEGFSAHIFGRVTNEKGQALPFATLHIKNTSIGTTTNNEGYYSLDIKPGNYQLVFQYVGYKTLTRNITIGDNGLELNISMEEEAFQLDEVVVNASNEDPAYSIIRKAITKRKEYLTEVEAYQCDVYIKGLQRLDKAPGKVLGFNVAIDTGIVYLSESVSEFSFRQPDKIKEVMVSSKLSGDNKAFSYNQASDMMFSFYENLLQVEGLNPRGFVSPIADNAFMFYDYELEGAIQENGYTINKIKVKPKRNSDPVFSGYIYILEDSWRIHSLDLLLTKENQIEFIDSLEIKQVYAPVGKEKSGSNPPWMMLSQSFNFQFKVFGFEGDGYFIGVHSNYIIGPEFRKGYFTNELLSISDEANKRDSLYWAKIRPVPLTRVEKIDYKTKDSLSVIKGSEHYMDSVDREKNKIGISNLLIGGYTYQKSYHKKTFRFEPLTQGLQFNTVEGFAPNFKLTYRKIYENRKSFNIGPELRYGFSSEEFYAKMEALYYYSPEKFAFGGVSFGRFTEQFNSENPITPFINTVYTLLDGHNYLKIYERSFVDLFHQEELLNGLKFSTKASYAERKPLFNSTDFSFRDKSEERFTPNSPANAEITNTAFSKHKALLLDLGLRIRIAQKYISRPNQKIVVESNYPELNIRYIKGLPDILGSDINFDRIEMSVSDEINFNLFGSGKYQFAGGTFLQTDSLAFMDFKHFNGNLTIFENFKINHFQLLDYYFYSTKNYWVEGHYEHHFNGFIFNKLPLVRKLKLQAVARVNYLRTEVLKNYFEVGFGIEHILKIGRVDFFKSFVEGKDTRTGIRVGIGF